MEQNLYNNQGAVISNTTLSQASISYLRGAAPWMKFISILGFIFCGFMVVAAFIMLIAVSAIGGRYGAGIGAVGAIIYLIVAVIIIFPNIYLFNYAKGISQFYNTSNMNALETAFAMQKKYWTFIGILMIIYLAIIVVSLLFTLGASMARF